MSATGGGRRKRKTEGGGDAWLLTYGDMVTLLMAFFVMLFAISSVEQEKFEAFVGGLDAFDNPAAGEPRLSPIGEPVLDTPPVDRSSAGAEPGDLGAGWQLQDLRERLVEAAAESGHGENVEIVQDARGLAVIVTTDDVLFDTGRATLRPDGHAIIASIAPELAAIPNELLVEGHADNVPLDRGGYTNWNLSTDRAVAVVDALVGRHGIEPHRLTAAGYGEFQPRDQRDTPEGRARNRRVEIVVLSGDTPAVTPAPAEPNVVDPIGNPFG